MLGQPLPPTDYDLRFSLFGIPVRISPYFWITAAILSWQDRQLHLTLLGIVCVLVTVLLHELGHAVVTRRLGFRSEIVLEFLGGYATTRSHSHWGNIAVAAAGPAAGLLLYAALNGVLQTSARETIFQSEVLRFIVSDLLLLNWAWSLMNLIPVHPLDGGQITRECIAMKRPYDYWQVTLKLSIAVAVGVATWSILSPEQVGTWLLLDAKFFAILFAYLAFQNFQMLQASSHGGW